MKFLESVKGFLQCFFSEYDASQKILATVRVYTHSVAYGPKDEEPKHLVTALFTDPRMIEKYGSRITVESKDLYFTTRTGDKLTLWLEANPDYDGKHKDTRLRLAEAPR